jgi:hypothetical protein
MAEAWQSQQRDAACSSLSFDERFAFLVDAEYMARDNRKLTRLLKDADLRIPSACLEDVDTTPGRGVDRAMIRQLATCSWLTEHLNTTAGRGEERSRWSAVVCFSLCGSILGRMADRVFPSERIGCVMHI